MSAAVISVRLQCLNIGANSVVEIWWIKDSTEDFDGVWQDGFVILNQVTVPDFMYALCSDKQNPNKDVTDGLF